MSVAYETYLINLKRVRNFVTLFELATGRQGKGRRGVQETDILRAGVVFLHSTFEEYLRSTILQRKKAMLLQDRDFFQRVLCSVNLAGDNSGRSNVKKYALADLWECKDENILTVVTDALEDKIKLATFNDYSQIVGSLREININLGINHNESNKIDNYITRRHKIVHEADKNAAQGSGHFISSAIGVRHINPWIEAVDGLVRDIEIKLPDSSLAAAELPD